MAQMSRSYYDPILDYYHGVMSHRLNVYAYDTTVANYHVYTYGEVSDNPLQVTWEDVVSGNEVLSEGKEIIKMTDALSQAFTVYLSEVEAVINRPGPMLPLPDQITIGGGNGSGRIYITADGLNQIGDDFLVKEFLSKYGGFLSKLNSKPGFRNVIDKMLKGYARGSKIWSSLLTKEVWEAMYSMSTEYRAQIMEVIKKEGLTNVPMKRVLEIYVTDMRSKAGEYLKEHKVEIMDALGKKVDVVETRSFAKTSFKKAMTVAGIGVGSMTFVVASLLFISWMKGKSNVPIDINSQTLDTFQGQTLSREIEVDPFEGVDESIKQVFRAARNTDHYTDLTSASADLSADFIKRHIRTDAGMIALEASANDSTLHVSYLEQGSKLYNEQLSALTTVLNRSEYNEGRYKVIELSKGDKIVPFIARLKTIPTSISLVDIKLKQAMRNSNSKKPMMTRDFCRVAISGKAGAISSLWFVQPLRKDRYGDWVAEGRSPEAIIITMDPESGNEAVMAGCLQLPGVFKD